jgi:hypothetical protein
MKCPHDKSQHVECEYLDTSGLTKTKECKDCHRYPDPVRKLMQTYEVEQMLNMLPKTIIKDKKQMFTYREIYDMQINRDFLGNWVIAYINDLSVRTLYNTSNPDLKRCTALMLAELISDKYIPV